MTARVTVRVPASTSNLGAGFDCVGVAVDRWLTLTATLDVSSRAPIAIERAGTLSTLTTAVDEDRLTAGVRAVCAIAGRPMPTGLTLRATSDIAVARGLGSSAAATVAGAVAANMLLGSGLDDHALAAAAADVEGHPDNVAAAVWGGAVLAFRAADRGSALTASALHVAPSLTLVLAVPDFAMQTASARRVLPATIPHAEACRAAALGAALVQGLASGDAALLTPALTGDVLHLPYRRALVTGYDNVVARAMAAGAYGATLSGAGSSLVAISPATSAPAVAAAMASAWRDAGVTADCFTSTPVVRGYSISRDGC